MGVKLMSEDENPSRLWAVVPAAGDDVNVAIIRAAIDEGVEKVVLFPAQGVVMLPVLIVALVLGASAMQILAAGTAVAMMGQPRSIKRLITKLTS